MRRFVAEALFEMVIESVLSECDLLIRYIFDLSVLWKKLADQAIQVLVCPAFPRSMRMREVILQTKFGRDLLMQRELFPVVRGQRVARCANGCSFSTMASRTLAACLLATMCSNA